MIDKHAPLFWVEAHDQPRRGAKENENGAPNAELSSPNPCKAPETITTVSRNLAVICPHPGEKVDTHNSPYHTKCITLKTAFDRIHQSEVTRERPGLAPRGASMRLSVHLNLDAARRKGSPRTNKAFGRIRPLKPLRGIRPIATQKTYDKTKTCLPKLSSDPHHTMLRMLVYRINTSMYARFLL
jgi:hypothetical protein